MILCILFIILGGHTLKYIKEFAVKIKIIANRAEDKNSQLLKQFNYQPKEAIAYNKSYQQWEAVFKNEIKKSRSLEYCNLLAYYLSKYDHVLYYPFRDRTSDNFNLLKPKPTFYTLLVVTSCCIAWMTTILLSAILQNVYTDILTVPLTVFIGVTVVISIISSVLNIICINRLFRIYLMNIKAAFRIDYGR